MGDGEPLCRRIRENLSAYLDGELKAGARRVIDEHLAECEACREHFRELKETWRLLDELEAPIVRRELADEVWTRIEADRRLGPVARLERATGGRGVLSGLAASVAAAVFLFGLYISSKPLSDMPTPAERESILYMDMLKDLETLEHMEMVRHVQELGQEISGPDDGDEPEDPGV